MTQHFLSKYQPEYDEDVIEHMKGGKSLSSFAASVGVCRSTIDNWRVEFPSFGDAVEVGKAACIGWWEENAQRQATMEKVGNPAITMFMLRNYGPHEFKERHSVEHINPAVQQVVQYQLPCNGRDQKDQAE